MTSAAILIVPEELVIDDLILIEAAAVAQCDRLFPPQTEDWVFQF